MGLFCFRIIVVEYQQAATENRPSYMKGKYMSDIRIVKKATCPSLSGRTTLSYHLGLNESAELFIRIHNNTGGGIYNDDWTALSSALTLLSDQEEPFSCSALSPLFKNRSNNTPGFIMAALLKEHLITEKDKLYQISSQKSVQDLTTELNKKASRRRKAA
jgi:hypothetical protein